MADPRGRGELASSGADLQPRDPAGRGESSLRDERGAKLPLRVGWGPDEFTSAGRGGACRPESLREPRARYRGRRPALPRVLLVEDDVLARRAALRAFGDQAELTVVASGEEALARFRPGAFDLVVAQQRMVVMTGLELLEQIRVRDPRVRRVLLAAAELPGMLGHLASGLVDLRVNELQELDASLPGLIAPKPS